MATRKNKVNTESVKAKYKEEKSTDRFIDAVRKSCERDEAMKYEESIKFGETSPGIIKVKMTRTFEPEHRITIQASQNPNSGDWLRDKYPAEKVMQDLSYVFYCAERQARQLDNGIRVVAVFMSPVYYKILFDRVFMFNLNEGGVFKYKGADIYSCDQFEDCQIFCSTIGFLKV